MKSNKKAAQVAGTRAASNTASDSSHSTATDPLTGRVDTCLAGQLALLAVLFVLLVCGVTA